jgi:hypothetical protein
VPGTLDRACAAIVYASAGEWERVAAREVRELQRQGITGDEPIRRVLHAADLWTSSRPKRAASLEKWVREMLR